MNNQKVYGQFFLAALLKTIQIEATLSLTPGHSKRARLRRFYGTWSDNMATNQIRKKHVVKDPVYGVMRWNESDKNVIKAIIDEPEFQRLRHIKQLGLTDLVFPGAVNTRFIHCLGAAYLGSVICDQVGLSKKDRELVIKALVLHDIGHGPFSHAFENLLDKEISHEEWTKPFLDSYVKKNILNGNDADEILRMIKHEPEDKRDIKGDIVSSQLDADRLDYLNRDSHFCGVTYGNFDVQWLIHSLRRIELGDGKKTARLGITKKGEGIIENYLTARRLLYKSVCFHKKIEVAQDLLIYFLKSLRDNIKNGTGFYKEIPSLNLREFLCEARKFTPKRKAGFIRRAFRYFKELCDYDIWATLKVASKSSSFPKESRVLAQQLLSRKLQGILTIRPEKIDIARPLIQEVQEKLKPWQINLCEPALKVYKSDQDPILVENEDGDHDRLDVNSAFAHSFSGINEKSYFLRIDPSVAKMKIIKSLVKTLEKKKVIVGGLSHWKKLAA